MTIDALDTTLEADCIQCATDECRTDTCRKLVAVGPCSTILRDNGTYVPPAEMIFDVNSWCRIRRLNSATYNPNSTIRKKGYVGECFEETIAGRRRPTLEVSFDFCKADLGHCLLTQDQCLIAWMYMLDRKDFQPNVSPVNQNCLRYGIARVEAGSETSTFDEDDIRTVTLHAHKYMWEYGFCNPANVQNQVISTFDDMKEVVA